MMNNSYCYFSLVWNVKLPEKIPVDGIRICTPIFIDLKEDFENMWTAEIIILEHYKSKYYGMIRYLFDGAPTHLLTEGSSFSFYDSLKSIATGQIISEDQLLSELD